MATELPRLVIEQTGVWFWALPDWVEWCRAWDLQWAGVRIYDVPDSEQRPVVWDD